jgi:tRNA uridine 5-carbamoylmethylation protein Kti12
MFGRKKDEETDEKIDEEIDEKIDEEIVVPDKYIPTNLEKISEEERRMRIDFLTSLIRENRIDHARLEKELKELLEGY